MWFWSAAVIFNNNCNHYEHLETLYLPFIRPEVIAHYDMNPGEISEHQTGKNKKIKIDHGLKTVNKSQNV